MKPCAAGVGILIVAVGLVVAGEGSPHEKVIQDMISSAESIGAKLKTILDEETAAAAKPDLKKANDVWVEARARSARLPAPEKVEKERLKKLYQPKLDDALKKMFSEIVRVQGIPGGKDALKEIAGVLKKDSK
jgi:hypothetical protein